MSPCPGHRSSQGRRSLAPFFCAERRLGLSCLTAVEPQWSSGPWIGPYVVPALCELAPMSLSPPRGVFWLPIVLSICEGAPFLRGSVACLARLPCLRSMAGSSRRAEVWGGLRQREESGDSVPSGRAFS